MLYRFVCVVLRNIREGFSAHFVLEWSLQHHTGEKPTERRQVSERTSQSYILSLSGFFPPLYCSYLQDIYNISFY